MNMPTTVFGWLYAFYIAVFFGMVFVAFLRIPPSPFRKKMATAGSMLGAAILLTMLVEKYFI